MIPRFIRILTLSLLVSLIPSYLDAQVVNAGGHGGGFSVTNLPMRTIQNKVWHIAGTVTDLRETHCSAPRLKLISALA